jgi:hypothetical protein
MRWLKKSWMCASFALALSTSAKASTTCQPTPQGPLCIAQVAFDRFAQSAYQTQSADRWCWAATISMVFAYYGHPVSQPRIVQDAYGSIVDMGANSGIVIARELNRPWQDDNGRWFNANVSGVFDFDAGISTLSNAQLISELDADRPVVYGSVTHAMVLTAIQYYPTPAGPNIVAAGVFDPWPGIGARGLSLAELTPIQQGGNLRFLATVRVADASAPPTNTPPGNLPASGAPGPAGPPPTTGPSGGCASTSVPDLFAAAVSFALFWRRSRRRVHRAASMPGDGCAEG